MLQLKWLEPRHMQHQIRRWDHSHRGEIETAFFNGSGMLIWENIFGVVQSLAGRRPPTLAARGRHPEPVSRALHVAAVGAVLPRRGPRASSLTAGRVRERRVFTLLNLGAPLKDTPLLEVRQG